MVATVREPAPLTLAFAAHYIALGAAEVHLFLDDPEDPAAEALAALPRTRVVRCDAEYWDRGLGRRPRATTARQSHNATRAYATTEADWLLHCDADEFLFLRRPLGEDLGRLGPEHGWLRMTVAERVWVEGQSGGLFDGAFRLPLPPDSALDRRAYGPLAPMLGRGLAGHVEGKALTATRRGFEVGIHAPSRPGEDGLPPWRDAWHAVLLHYDGVTPRHWAAKTLRYAGLEPDMRRAMLHPARSRQVDHVVERGGDVAAALALHRSLFTLSLDQAALLDAAEALAYAHIDPGAALAGISPGCPLPTAQSSDALLNDGH